MKIRYKNIDLNLKGILIRVLITTIIAILLFIVLPKVLYIVNHPVYRKNMKFTYYYLYESGDKNFNLGKGHFQEIYTRGVGQQSFHIEKNDDCFFHLNIDCLNKEGNLEIYLRNVSENKKVVEIIIPPKNNIVKDVHVYIKKDENYILIIDHKYTDGGLYLEWSYTRKKTNGGGAGNRTQVQKR